jgi:hypothetical protein
MVRRDFISTSEVACSGRDDQHVFVSDQLIDFDRGVWDRWHVDERNVELVAVKRLL